MSIWDWCRDHWTFSPALSLLFYPEIWTLRLSLQTRSIFFKINTKEKVAYLLYDSRNNSSCLNKEFIKLVIKFFKSTGRFNESLIFFNQWNIEFPTVFTTRAVIIRCSWKGVLGILKRNKTTQSLGMPVGGSFLARLQVWSLWLC